MCRRKFRLRFLLSRILINRLQSTRLALWRGADYLIEAVSESSVNLHSLKTNKLQMLKFLDFQIIVDHRSNYKDHDIRVWL